MSHAPSGDLQLSDGLRHDSSTILVNGNDSLVVCSGNSVTSLSVMLVEEGKEGKREILQNVKGGGTFLPSIL